MVSGYAWGLCLSLLGHLENSGLSCQVDMELVYLFWEYVGDWYFMLQVYMKRRRRREGRGQRIEVGTRRKEEKGVEEAKVVRSNPTTPH